MSHFIGLGVTEELAQDCHLKIELNQLPENPEPCENLPPFSHVQPLLLISNTLMILLLLSGTS